jgi:hypothetical protein
MKREDHRNKVQGGFISKRISYLLMRFEMFRHFLITSSCDMMIITHDQAKVIMPADVSMYQASVNGVRYA